MGKLQDSDYYCNYYADTGTCDEVVYLAKLQAGNVINLSMMRLAEHAPFTDEDYESSTCWRNPCLSCSRAIRNTTTLPPHNLIQPGIDHHIDLAFRTFGASLLSPREKDVLELMLRGYGTDISAERLDHRGRNRSPTPQKHLSQSWMSAPRQTFSPCFLNAMSCMGQAAAKILSASTCRPVAGTLCQHGLSQLSACCTILQH